jgi:hypothetical protein
LGKVFLPPQKKMGDRPPVIIYDLVGSDVNLTPSGGVTAARRGSGGRPPLVVKRRDRTIEGFYKVPMGGSIPDPGGVAGETIDDDQPYGPAWQKELLGRIQLFYGDTTVMFVNRVASHLGKSGSDLMEKSDGATILNNLNDFARIIQERSRRLDSGQLRDERVIGRSGDLDAARPTTEAERDARAIESSRVRTREAATTSDATGNQSEVTAVKYADSARLPRKFDREKLLQWLLEVRGGHASSTDLSIANELFKVTNDTLIDWLFHPFISGMVPLSQELTGAVSYTSNEIIKEVGNQRLDPAKVPGGKLSASVLVEEFMDMFAYLVAMRMRLSQGSRFSIPSEVHRMAGEWASKVKNMATSLMAPGGVAVSDRDVLWARDKFCPEFMRRPGRKITSTDRLIWGVRE